MALGPINPVLTAVLHRCRLMRIGLIFFCESFRSLLRLARGLGVGGRSPYPVNRTWGSRVGVWVQHIFRTSAPLYGCGALSSFPKRGGLLGFSASPRCFMSPLAITPALPLNLSLLVTWGRNALLPLPFMYRGRTLSSRGIRRFRALRIEALPLLTPSFARSNHAGARLWSGRMIGYWKRATTTYALGISVHIARDGLSRTGRGRVRSTSIAGLPKAFPRINVGLGRHKTGKACVYLARLDECRRDEQLRRPHRAGVERLGERWRRSVAS